MPEIPKETGAPAALRAIEIEEANARAHRDECEKVYLNACRDAQTKPMEKDGTDWDRMEAVAKRHLDDAESRLNALRKLLLTYDKSVTPEKRDSTERITREQGERLFSMISIYLLQNTEAFITSFCQDVLSCKTPADVHKLSADKLRECLSNSVDSGIRESHLPAWVRAPFEEIL